MHSSIEYSVVVPLKNEEENIVELIEEIEPVMFKLGKPFEILCIDDGSTDNTLKLLKNLVKTKSYLKVVTFTRNFGQSSAFDAGFRLSRGKFVITLDGDRQNDPRDIPQLIREMKEADLVCGWRKDRQDPSSKKWISKFSNKIRSQLCRDNMHDTGCSLKVYRSECLKTIKMYHGMHRFLPALFKIEGYRVKEVPVRHRERTKGKTKYHFFNRSIGPIVDMLAVCWMRKRQLRYRIHEQVNLSNDK